MFAVSYPRQSRFEFFDDEYRWKWRRNDPRNRLQSQIRTLPDFQGVAIDDAGGAGDFGEGYGRNEHKDQGEDCGADHTGRLRARAGCHQAAIWVKFRGWASLKFGRNNARTVGFLADHVCIAPNGRTWRTVIGTAAPDPVRTS